MGKKVIWNPIYECDDDDGNPHVWSAEINHRKYGYETEFKCKNKREVLKAIEQLAEEFQKEEKHISKSKKG